MCTFKHLKRFRLKFSIFVMALLGTMGATAQAPDTAFKPYVQTIPNTAVQFKLVPIPGGTFTMGSGATDKSARPDEMPQRTVTISPFWMGVYEVTHDEFDQFFNDDATSQNSTADAVTRPSPQYIDLSWGMGREGGYPANSMQQLAAMMYCRWLYQKTGVFYRLPTEAEWEYAARAGSTTIYPFGNDSKELDKHAWHKGNSKSVYHKVGQKAPNAWGLYDMLGNVAEWTQEQYDEKKAKELEAKIRKNQFDFNDFLGQLHQIKKMGNVKDLLGMLPGMGKALKDVDIQDDAFKHIEAIIYSMTPKERSNPALLNGNRKNRIANGSGTSIQEVNKLLKQFEDTRKMMKMMSNPKNMMGMMKQFKGMRGGM